MHEVDDGRGAAIPGLLATGRQGPGERSRAAVPGRVHAATGVGSRNRHGDEVAKK